MCMDSIGRLLTNKNEILNYWVDHLERLLRNCYYGLKSSSVVGGKPTLVSKLFWNIESEDNLLSYEEMHKTIKKLANKKSLASDKIPSEILKIAGMMLFIKLHSLIMEI